MKLINKRLNIFIIGDNLKEVFIGYYEEISYLKIRLFELRDN